MNLQRLFVNIGALGLLSFFTRMKLGPTKTHVPQPGQYVW